MKLLKIGRDKNCDIVINNPRVSSLHAELIILNNGDILLEDKNSTNGTTVLNRPIKPGVNVNVKRGDTIRFADSELDWGQVPTQPDLSQYSGVYSIGSNFRNDIQVSGNNVSRFHATLKIDKKGNAYLEDHSTNGTTVNGQRIPAGKDVKIKRSDVVTCAGTGVDLSSYLPKKFPFKKLGLIAGAAALIGLVAWALAAILTSMMGKSVTPKDTVAMENGVACVYGGYYPVVTLKDDPFRNVINGWPDKWYVGFHEKTGELTVANNTNELKPFSYTGTAFFISNNGELGTNRHVAVPWKYLSKNVEELIRQQMEIIRNGNSKELAEMLNLHIQIGTISYENAQAWFNRFQKSDIDIDGEFAYLGLGLTGSKIDNANDLKAVQVIAESEDERKDVALIRTKDRRTPDYLVKMGAIYDIENARVDEKSLKPQEDDLMVIGYPLGERVSNESFDGKELHPTIHKTSPSKTPDEYNIQIQTAGVGGQSGSPVIDSDHRLVGVLCSGFGGTEITYCCNIKHLKDIYDRNKVR